METEDVGHLLLRFERRRARLVRRVAGERRPQEPAGFEVDGPDGALAWNSERHEELWLGHRDRPNELLWRERRRSTRPATPRASPTRSRTSTDASTRRSRRASRATDYPTFARRPRPRTCSPTPSLRSHAEQRLDGGRDVKLGLLTAAFPTLTLDEIAAWASAERLRDARGRLLARRRRRAAPLRGRLPHRRRHARRRDAVAIGTLERARGSRSPSLAYYPNNLGPDDAQRARRRNAHLRKVIDAGAGARRRHRRHVRRPRPTTSRCPRTSTLPPSCGRRSWHYAGERGVRIAIENCPMIFSLRRVAGRHQPRLRAGDLGRDVRRDPRRELRAQPRPVAPRLAA